MSTQDFGSLDPIEAVYDPEEQEDLDAWERWKALRVEMLATGQEDPRSDEDMRLLYDERTPGGMYEDDEETRVLPFLRARPRRAATVLRREDDEPTFCRCGRRAEHVRDGRRAVTHWCNKCVAGRDALLDRIGFTVLHREDDEIVGVPV